MRGVDLSIKQGECLGLIGESGSGKSVTALSIMGLVASPPGVITGGSVYFKDNDLVQAPYDVLRKLRAIEFHTFSRSSFHAASTLHDRSTIDRSYSGASINIERRRPSMCIEFVTKCANTKC